MKRSKYNMASFLIVLFYLAMSDFFGIVDFSLLFPGEMYDYVIALTFVLAILIFFKSRCIVKITNIHFEFWPFLGVIMIAVIQAILMQTQRQQSFSESFSVIRELAFIFVFAGFCLLNYNPYSLVKLIIKFDIISVCVYALEMICGGPIFNASIHATGIYEILGGLRIWRCWVDIPTFELFTIPYLLISVVRKDYVFYTRRKDMTALCIILLGVILKLGRGELVSVCASAMIAYFCVDRPSAGKLLKRISKVVVLIIVVMGLMFIFANGIFQRLISGVIAVLNLTNSSESTTLSIRTQTLVVRWNYLLDHNAMLFGIGPYSYKAQLVIDPFDTFATNRGVFSPDNAYATFLVRYGVIGTALYVFGFVKNFFNLKKDKSKLFLALGSLLLGSLIGGFSGYDALGKQTLIKVGLLLALCIKERKYVVLRRSHN